jgi:TolB-like protein
VLALAIATVGATIAYFSHLSRPEQAINSIAVLPFANVSGNQNAEYLSDGITEGIINSLSQLAQLKVIARSSVFKYKGKEMDPQEVARALDVRAVLTGRVLQRGDTFSISTELVDALDKRHLWGEQYNHKASDLLAVQGEIVREISEKLRLRLTGAEQSRMTKRYTDNAEAYDLYLKGRYQKKNTGEGLKRAIGYFQQAIYLDPNFAMAYVDLSATYDDAGTFSFIALQESVEKSKAAVGKALEIDDTLAEAHARLASIKLNSDWDFFTAEREDKRAIELNPNSASAHHGYGFCLVVLGRFDEGLAELKRAE